jgi:hypothetical protein
MAILTFEDHEGEFAGLSPDGKVLHYHCLFSPRSGRLGSAFAGGVRRIREVRPDEAAALARFFLKAGMLSELRLRSSPEDWQALLDALPEPSPMA